jgi:hypothetical protein
MRQAGVSVIGAVLALLILSVLVAVSVSLVTTGGRSGLYEEQGGKAFYIAEGGLQYSLPQVKNSPSYSGDTDKPLGEGAFTVTVSSGPGVGQRTISSTGKITYGTFTTQRIVNAVVQGGEAITDGGFTDLANWPDGDCKPNRNQGTVSIVDGALSIATNAARKQSMKDCRQQSLAVPIPPATDVTLSLRYYFSSTHTCSDESEKTTAKCEMSVIFVYSDGSEEEPWTNSDYPTSWASTGDISWTTKADVNLTDIKLFYDIKSANAKNAQTTGWLDDVSLTSPFVVTSIKESF